jgi:ATP/maltotriose-dependent transcriptional regulator MalT
MATACLGWATAASGNATEGLGMLQGVRQGFLDAGVEILNPLFATAQADACLRCGEAEAGLQLLETTIPHAVAKNQVAYLAEQHRLRGELALLAGRDRDGAEMDFREALALAREQGARSYELRAALSLAGLLQGSDRVAEALELLREIRGSIVEGEDTPDVQAADRILASGSPSALEGHTR